MEEFWDDLKKWLDRQQEDGAISGWGLVEDPEKRVIGVDMTDGEELFISVEPA